LKQVCDNKSYPHRAAVAGFLG